MSIMRDRLILLADRQDITRAGMTFLIEQEDHHCQYKYISDKVELLEALKRSKNAVVILDYTLFDLNGADDVLIISQRYPEVNWLLFSTDLNAEFVKSITVQGPRIGVLFKESSLSEIKEALNYTINGHRYICQRAMEMMLMPETKNEEVSVLTKTETEILIDIANGMTTKEIAERRFSSFHTVNTHRKNIFRKLKVNNVHEATKYAIRAGLIDTAEYNI